MVSIANFTIALIYSGWLATLWYRYLRTPKIVLIKLRPTNILTISGIFAFVAVLTLCSTLTPFSWQLDSLATISIYFTLGLMLVGEWLFPPALTKQGYLSLHAFIPWHNIASYSWSKSRSGQLTLILQVTKKGKTSSQKIDVSSEKQDEVKTILHDYLSV